MADDRIGAVRTAFGVLEALEDGPAGVTELADRLDLHKSTVHHHLATLVDAGYAVRDDGEYALGLAPLTLGGRARDAKRLYHVGAEEAEGLAAETNADAQLVVEEHGRGYYIYQATGSGRPDDRPTGLGTQVGLHSSAAGKAILAELPAERRDALLGRDLPAYTAATATDPERLREEFAAVRDRGVAFDDGEQFEGVRCVAAPVTLEDRTVLGAMSVTVDAATDERRFREELPEQLTNFVGAARINAAYASLLRSE